MASQMRGICEHEPKALRSYEVICRIGQNHHGGPCPHKESTAEIEQALERALSGGRASAEGAGDGDGVHTWSHSFGLLPMAAFP